MHVVRVVVGVIKKNQQLLIAKRPETVVMPGYWEFPGGKVEPNEADFDTLVRELNEEIGITVIRGDFLAQFNHYLEARRIELNVWLVKEYQGEPCGNEGQEICWVTPAEFGQYRFLPSNDFLISYLTEAQDLGVI